MSKQTNDNNISYNSNIANPNVIKDTSNNLEFDVDWETVERNYKYDSHHHIDITVRQIQISLQTLTIIALLT